MQFGQLKRRDFIMLLGSVAESPLAPRAAPCAKPALIG
jgi:hypothetical protein